MFRSVILRFVLPVALASCVVAYFGLPYIQRLLAEWFRADVEQRAELAMHSMEEPIAELVGQGNESHLRSYLTRMTSDERLLAVLVCRPDGKTIVKTERTPAAISCDVNGKAGPAATRIMQLPSGSVQVSVAAGEVLDDVVLRSYALGAVHQALGWVRTEGIAVDDTGAVLDLTVRSFGIIAARDMPEVEIVVEDGAGPPVPGGDTVFAAVAAAAWLAAGLPPRWPVDPGGTR